MVIKNGYADCTTLIVGRVLFTPHRHPELLKRFITGFA